MWDWQVSLFLGGMALTIWLVLLVVNNPPGQGLLENVVDLTRNLNEKAQVEKAVADSINRSAAFKTASQINWCRQKLHN